MRTASLLCRARITREPPSNAPQLRCKRMATAPLFLRSHTMVRAWQHWVGQGRVFALLLIDLSPSFLILHPFALHAGAFASAAVQIVFTSRNPSINATTEDPILVVPTDSTAAFNRSVIVTVPASTPVSAVQASTHACVLVSESQPQDNNKHLTFMCAVEPSATPTSIIFTVTDGGELLKSGGFGKRTCCGCRAVCQHPKSALITTAAL